MKTLLLMTTFLISFSSLASDLDTSKAYPVEAGDKIVLISAELSRTQGLNAIEGANKAEVLLGRKCAEIDGVLVGSIKTMHDTDVRNLTVFNPAALRYFSICKY